jgi:hypothetical protein
MNEKYAVFNPSIPSMTRPAPLSTMFQIQKAAKIEKGRQEFHNGRIIVVTPCQFEILNRRIPSPLHSLRRYGGLVFTSLAPILVIPSPWRITAGDGIKNL